MPIEVQYFKGDSDELKIDGSLEPILEIFSGYMDDFNAGAYTCTKLGELIWDEGRSPLSNAIVREVFRRAFTEIFQSFVEVGTFEAYISVFQKIFGDDLGIAFTVPGPGQLNIDITAATIETNNFVARKIESNAYVFENVLTQDDEQLLFQTVLGLTSEYELGTMLFEMVPGGVYTQITLSLGA